MGPVARGDPWSRMYLAGMVLKGKFDLCTWNILIVHLAAGEI